MRVCPTCHLCISALTHQPCNEAAVEVEATELTGELTIKFTDVAPFARGSTGTLYLATHAASGHRGVLKLVTEAGLGSGTERVRAKRELRKQTTLPPAALVPVLDGGEIGTMLWLFREHVHGQSLAARIAERGPLSVQETLSVVAQAAIGLDQLHRNGLLHRDLKPSHMLLATDESEGLQVQLIDAGLAAPTKSDGVLNLIGTAEYLSPEQASSKPVSFRSDLYALGCIFYEALMGKPMFSGDTASVLAAQRESLAPEVTVDLPDVARDLLRSMLDKEPRRRPFSAQQVRRTLEPLLTRPLPQAVLSASAASSAASLRPPSPAQKSGTKVAAEGNDTEALNTVEIAALSIEDYGGRPTELLSSQEIDILHVEDSNDAAHVASSPPPRRNPHASSPPPVPGAGTPNSATISAMSTVMVGHSQNGAANGGWVDASPPDVHPLAGDDRLNSEAPPSLPPYGTSESQVEPVPEEPSTRRAVNFDVESLFAGESSPPEADGGFEDAAPTRLMQRMEPASATEFSPEPDSVAPPRKRAGVRAWAYLAAPIAVALLWIVFTSGDEAPPQGSNAATEAGHEETKPATEVQAAASPAATKTAEATQPAKGESTAGDSQGNAEPTAAQADEPPTSGDKESEAKAAEEAKVAEQAKAAEQEAPAPSTTADKAESTEETSHAKRHKPVKAKLKDAGPSTDEIKVQARQAFSANRYAEAVKLYQQVTKMSPSDAGAYAGLGASQLASGDKKGAVASYQRAVQLQPQSSGFHAALGRAYFESGDKARSITSYKKAIELNPENGAAKAALARLQ